MKRIALFAATLLACARAFACINGVGTDYHGRHFEGFEPFAPELAKRIELSPLQSITTYRDAREIIASARKRPGPGELTDLGILLVMQGKYDAAIRHFLRVEQLFPGLYQTAGNLGTALELAGRNDIALRWIRIGMRRNPREHQGTEWLHARILEAKLAIARNPDAMKGRSVAGLYFKPWIVPPLPRSEARENTGRPLSAYDAQAALAYQLYERLVFVKPEDPIVASLLEDAATLQLSGGALEDARDLYELAVRYGATRTPLIQQREAYIRRVLKRSAASNDEGGRCLICRDDVMLPSTKRR